MVSVKQIIADIAAGYIPGKLWNDGDMPPKPISGAMLGEKEREDDLLLSTEELMAFHNPDVPQGSKDYSKFMGSKWWRINNLYWIVDEHGQRVRFRCNYNQQWLWENSWFLNVLLKARQFGGTTWIDICYLDDCVLQIRWKRGSSATIKMMRQKIFKRKIQYPYKNLPDYIKQKAALTTDRQNRAGIY